MRDTEAKAEADTSIKVIVDKELMFLEGNQLLVNKHLRAVYDEFMSFKSRFKTVAVQQFLTNHYQPWLTQNRQHFLPIDTRTPNNSSMDWSDQELIEHLAFRFAADSVRAELHPIAKSDTKSEATSMSADEASGLSTASIGSEEVVVDEFKLTARQATLMLYAILSELNWDVSGKSSRAVARFMATITSFKAETHRENCDDFHLVQSRYTAPDGAKRCKALKQDISQIKRSLEIIGKPLPRELERLDSELDDSITQAKTGSDKDKQRKFQQIGKNVWPDE